jgi:hypothetical protein
MKKVKFEKINEKLTKEEMNFITGGLNTPTQGATLADGDSYSGGAFGKDPGKDTYTFSWYMRINKPTTISVNEIIS